MGGGQHVPWCSPAPYPRRAEASETDPYIKKCLGLQGSRAAVDPAGLSNDAMLANWKPWKPWPIEFDALPIGDFRSQ